MNEKSYARAILEQLLAEILEMNMKELTDDNGKYLLSSGAVQDKIRFKIERLKRFEK